MKDHLGTRYANQANPYIQFRGGFLYVLAAPLGLTWIRHLFLFNPIKLLLTSLVLAALLYAAYLTREYFKSQYDQLFDARAITNDRQRHTAMLLLTGGAFILMLSLLKAPALMAVVFAGLAALGYHLCYGTVQASPLRERAERREKAFSALPKELGNMMRNAVDHISSLYRAQEDLIKSQDHEINDLLSRVNKKASAIVDLIKDDPQQIRNARKFLVVYLEELANISKLYADLFKNGEESKMRPQFLALLQEAEQSFDDHHHLLIEQNSVRFETQMEVLTEQLKQEGIEYGRNNSK